MNTLHTRLSGVLVHPTSFPSPYGIGDLGQGAYDFIDFLKASGQSLWQVLPLGPTGFGDSPYQSFSAFAGQSLLISPDDLVDLELITKDDLYPIPEFDAAKVDYGAVLNYKNGLFKKAFQTFHHTPNKFLLEEFDDFCLENKKWLSDYAVFMACKDAHEGRSWQEWDDEMTTPTAKVRLAFETEYKEQIKYYKFIQFLFFREWMKLKNMQMKLTSRSSAIFRFSYLSTVPMSGQTKSSISLIRKVIRFRLPEFRQTISVQPDSSGAIRSTTGNTMKLTAIPGGSTVSKCR